MFMRYLGGSWGDRDLRCILVYRSSFGRLGGLFCLRGFLDAASLYIGWMRIADENDKITATQQNQVLTAVGSV